MAVLTTDRAQLKHQRAPQGMLWLVSVVLWLTVLVSALAVVYSTHQARLLTNQLAAAEAESARLQVQRGQYLLERSAWGAYSRVETLAAEQLHMTLPQAEHIVVVEQ